MWADTLAGLTVLGCQGRPVITVRIPVVKEFTGRVTEAVRGAAPTRPHPGVLAPCRCTEELVYIYKRLGSEAGMNKEMYCTKLRNV